MLVITEGRLFGDIDRRLQQTKCVPDVTFIFTLDIVHRHNFHILKCIEQF